MLQHLELRVGGKRGRGCVKGGIVKGKGLGEGWCKGEGRGCRGGGWSDPEGKKIGNEEK